MLRSRHEPMSWPEFETLPHELGWVYEYFGGAAHIRPSERIVAACCDVARSRLLLAGVPDFQAQTAIMRAVSPHDEERVVESFRLSFADSVEFCDWDEARFEAYAREAVATHLAGRNGRPLNISRVMEYDGQIVGAALLLGKAHGVELDMVWVVPQQQRTGIATALLRTALHDLGRTGETQLHSYYVLANAPSAAWHRRCGFAPEPDLSLARYFLSHTRHELARRQAQSDSTGQCAALQHQCAHWEAQVRELEDIAERDGYEAVTPILRRR